MENERRILFWNDDWLGPGALKDLFPDLFISPNAAIEESWSSKGWNLPFGRILNDWEDTRATEFPRML